MTPPQRSRRRTTRPSGPIPRTATAQITVSTDHTVAGAIFGPISPTSHNPLVYNPSTSHLPGSGSPSEQLTSSPTDSVSHDTGPESPPSTPVLPSYGQLPSYTALTSQAIEQHDTCQTSVSADAPNGPPVPLHSTSLPSHMHPPPTQTQLYMSPMEYFQTPSTFPHQQHNDYSPLSEHLATSYITDASSNMQHANTPSLQVNPSIDGYENYLMLRSGAHYFPGISYYPTEAVDWKRDLASIGEQFSGQEPSEQATDFVAVVEAEI